MTAPALGRGPSSARMTLPGLRSRWMRPQSWIAARPSAMPPRAGAPLPHRAGRAGRWPRPGTAPRCRRWPSTAGPRRGPRPPPRRCGNARLAGGGHLAGEPAAELRVVRVVRVHHLDRDLAPAGRLAQEHPAHAALGQAAQQPERADLAGVPGAGPIRQPRPLASTQDPARRLLQAGDTVTSPQRSWITSLPGASGRRSRRAFGGRGVRRWVTISAESFPGREATAAGDLSPVAAACR